jgi:16S rRNA (adenine1518-N6/adenine1519-N6)-dimethyltransferase
MYAKKSLGQHFLKSEKALRSIIDAGEIKKSDTILEIGPGTGTLTEKLLAKAEKVIAVEKDDELYSQLKTKFPELKLVHGDILDFKPEAISYKLIANIPYNITGAILEKFLSADYQPERMVLLVQKEVAERIVAKDGKESILSISVKAYGRPKYVEKVLAGSFAPAPKVDSAILLIEDISKEFFSDFKEKDFFSMIKVSFSSKRKKLSSNLSKVYDKEKVRKAFETLGFDENTRAEDVSIDDWRRLGSILCV